MGTTKARSPNLIWHLKCLEDYIRISTEFSMHAQVPHTFLALHVLPSIVFLDSLFHTKLCCVVSVSVSP
jgi:hypothetical protein